MGNFEWFLNNVILFKVEKSKFLTEKKVLSKFYVFGMCNQWFSWLPNAFGFVFSAIRLIKVNHHPVGCVDNRTSSESNNDNEATRLQSSNSNQRVLPVLKMKRNFYHFLGEPRPPFQPKNSPLVLDNNMNSNGNVSQQTSEVNLTSSNEPSKENTTPLRTHASTSRLLEKR